MDFEAFSKSVLLRQGKADEIITATGSRRLEILKQIIGIDRFEDLSKRVHTKKVEHEGNLKALRVRRDGQTAVTICQPEETRYQKPARVH